MCGERDERGAEFVGLGVDQQGRESDERLGRQLVVEDRASGGVHR